MSLLSLITAYATWPTRDKVTPYGKRENQRSLRSIALALREKCPNREFFLVRIFLYSVLMQENADQKKLPIWTLFTQCSYTEVQIIIWAFWVDSYLSCFDSKSFSNNFKYLTTLVIDVFFFSQETFEPLENTNTTSCKFYSTKRITGKFQIWVN